MKKHYVNKHRINSKIYCFEALFEKYDEIFILRNCYRCDDFITSCSEEIQHNFINHYQIGGKIPLENRQFKKTSDGTIIRFEIHHDAHKNSYDFADPVKLLEDFFEVVNINFANDEKKRINSKVFIFYTKL